MKKIIPIILFFTIILLINNYCFAFGEIPGGDQIAEVSIDYDTSKNLKDIGFDFLKIIKIFLQGILVIFIVYTGGQIIMSMGDNEEQLSNSKRHLWYSIIALLFINIPGTLYDSFKRTSYNTIDTLAFQGNNTSTYLDGNIFVNSGNFKNVLENNIIQFFEVIISISAIIMLTISAYKIMTSSGNEENVKKAKDYFIYSILGLIFAGIIKAWKGVVASFNIKEGVDLFSKLANILLFISGPIAIFFMILAGYYYITSNGKEENVKKAKNIIINTIIGIIILLASYSLLKDISSI